MRRIVIQGAGICGLSLAWFLHKRYGNEIELTVVDKADRVGGWIQTVEQDGFLFELGPRGFRPRGEGEKTLELVRDLELEGELLPASPACKRRYIYKGGKFHTLSPWLLLRLGALPERRTPPPEGDESLHAFFSRRFGLKFADWIIDPLAIGIYSGDAHALSVRSCFPNLPKWEREYGSVVKGFFKHKKKRGKHPPLYSFKGGMETLVHRLANRLPARILLNTDASQVEGDLTLSALPETTYPLATLTTVSLGWNRPLLKKKGFGYLVPTTANSPLLGVTFDSHIFPSHPGTTRLCVMLREKIDPLPLLSTHLGITTPPDTLHTHTAKRAIPQFLVGLPSPSRNVGINAAIAYAAQLVRV